MKISDKYAFKTTPKANPEAVVPVENCRFTLLTSQLLRIEYSENDEFEDRATQIVVNRKFDVPKFSVNETDDKVHIITSHFHLVYRKGPFNKNSITVSYTGLSANVRAGGSAPHWSFNDIDSDNLKGTIRTIDMVEGACMLDNGIISTGPVTVLDDSKSFVFKENGVLERRQKSCVDIYLFCYGSNEKKFDCLQCLKDYYKLTGQTPMLPRYALGNWWSKYHKYTQDEYVELMKRFKREDIPFSVAILDMDWHLVDIESKYGSGWTGYTWNEELFPDRISMLEFLKKEGLEVALNLHPYGGIAAHEKQYKEFAERMGIDPQSEETIPFEIDNPDFTEVYFDLLHKPMEKEGVSFWWVDWQQGDSIGRDGIDPLWLLNHFHYIESERENKRGLILSRYAGPGSHRYPIGFSGDSVASWETLDFQPYFTATASNIGYTWWSHDIEGHCLGSRDEELSARWLQYGVFSPINRLHCGRSRFLGKEPWNFNRMTEASMKKFLRLRHELIPYIYTMNHLTCSEGIPLVRPLYYEHTDYELCENKNEYYFGSEMLVAPITRHSDDETLMGSVSMYLPKGRWYDFFNSKYYEGDRRITVYRNLEEMPVFVKAGGIIPMAKLSHTNDIENPENMKIKVFAGDSNCFCLYEDDGITNNYRNKDFAITRFELKWGNAPELEIIPPFGRKAYVPKFRNYEIEFIGIQEYGKIAVYENERKIDFDTRTENGKVIISVNNVCDRLKIVLEDVAEYYEDLKEQLCERIEKFEKLPLLTKTLINMVLTKNSSVSKILGDLYQLKLSEHVFNAILEVLTAGNRMCL